MSLYLEKKYIRLGAGILLAGALIWIYMNYDYSEYLNIGAMRALINSYGAYGPLIFIGFCIAGIFLHLPGVIIIALGGLLFGIVEGFVYGWLGVMIGIVGTFICVRYIFRDFFQNSLENRFHRLRAFDERLAQHGFITVLLLRFILFLAPPLNWVIGITRVKFRHYFSGSALGVIPGIAAAKSKGTLLTGDLLSAVLAPGGFFGKGQ